MTDDGIYEVYTGVGDVNDLTIIRKWEKSHAIKTWPNNKDGSVSQCNLVNGTDAATFPPHLKAEPRYLDIFSTDICRSVRIYYQQKTAYNGIPALRFVTRDDFLNQIGPKYGKDCFCTNIVQKIPIKADGCLYSGAMDLSPCLGNWMSMGGSIITSLNLIGIAYPSVNFTDVFFFFLVNILCHHESSVWQGRWICL